MSRTCAPARKKWKQKLASIRSGGSRVQRVPLPSGLLRASHGADLRKPSLEVLVDVLNG